MTQGTLMGMAFARAARPHRPRTLRRLVALAALTALAAVTSGVAIDARPADAGPAPDFLRETYATGLVVPTDVEWAPNGLLFVAEQAGVVKVVDNGTVSTFVDIRGEVNFDAERGLLGIAVHPGFTSGSPYVYALYTYDPPETASQTGNAGPDGSGLRVSRLTRFTADAANGFKTAVPGSATTILGAGGDWAAIGAPGSLSDTTTVWACGNPPGVDNCIPADSRNHTIGTVAFGNDGMLYVGNGDASGFQAESRSLRALDVDSLAGKVMRIHPDTGLGLPDNPFWDGDADSNRSRVWHLGVRNPFRFTFDGAGDVWIGDVGSGEYEEINSAAPGSDFGWPCYEGGAAGSSVENPDFAPFSQCQAYYASNNAVAPVHAYSHVPGPGAIVVGEFVSGTQWPAAYHGGLIVGDYVRMTLDSIDVSGVPVATTGLATEIIAVSATFGPDGHLYLASIATGSIDRIRYAPGEQPPGSLRTTTAPAVPSMISLDGIDRTQWGLDWLDLEPTTYQQCFTDVPGFVTPPCQPVTVVSGATTAAQGPFTAKSSLQVTTRVSGTASSGVPSVISIDGVPASQWGLLADFDPGVHEVCWGSVADFATPACQTVNLVAGGAAAVEGVFEPQPGAPGPSGATGFLRVQTTPAVPSTVLVDGVAAQQFGLEWVPTPTGTYDVCFTDVPGFVTPPCETVTVVQGATTVVNGVFDRMGSIRVTTVPASNVAISVDGVARNQWGLLTAIAPGTYQVCAAFDTGDSCGSAVVVAGAETAVPLSPQGGGQNQPPTASAGPDQTVVDADGDGFASVVLDGSGSSDSDGVIVSWAWSEAGAPVASGVSPAVSLAVGTHTLDLVVTDDDGSTAADAVVVTVEDPPPPVVHLSMNADNSVGGVAYTEEDVVSFDLATGTWAMYFNGSQVGLPAGGGRNLDAFHRLDDGTLLFSTERDGSLPGVGAFTESDILRFTPTSLGSTTTGTVSMYFDGSDVDLDNGNENIDAVSVLANGDIIVSTNGTPAVAGVAGVDSSDLLRFAPTSLGTTTEGTWSIYLDGSDVGLGTAEQIVGVWVAQNGDISFTTAAAFAVPGAAGGPEDVVTCVGPTTGPVSSCSAFVVLFDGSANGMTDGVDAVFVGQ